jgi:hypothetical protein
MNGLKIDFNMVGMVLYWWVTFRACRLLFLAIWLFYGFQGFLGNCLFFLWCGGFNDGGFSGDMECWTVELMRCVEMVVYCWDSFFYFGIKIAYSWHFLGQWDTLKKNRKSPKYVAFDGVFRCVTLALSKNRIFGLNLCC